MLGRLAVRGAMGAGGYLLGQGLQDRFGGVAPEEEPPPPPAAGPGARSRLEQYQLEQQTNQFYPEGRSFMGGGIWTAGNLTSPVIPDAVMRPAVENMSAPSNPDADRNRALVAAAPAMLAPVPYVGPLAMLAAGLLSGSESSARRQAAQVPRVAPPDSLTSDPMTIGRGYERISQEYADAGLGPQAAVTRLMPPARENAFVSQGIYQNLTGQASTHFNEEHQ